MVEREESHSIELAVSFVCQVCCSGFRNVHIFLAEHCRGYYSHQYILCLHANVYMGVPHIHVDRHLNCLDENDSKYEMVDYLLYLSTCILQIKIS